MNRLTLEEVKSETLKRLGLRENVEIDGAEVISVLIRRIASSMCPCPSYQIERAVFESIKFLTLDSEEDLRERIGALVDALVFYGDLVEPGDGQVYLRTPGFVRRKGGSIFLIGVGVNEAQTLPEDLRNKVQHQQYLRRLRPAGITDGELAQRLEELSLVEVPTEVWERRSQIPEDESPNGYLSRMRSRLEASGPVGSIEELEILDPTRHVRYYRGRWRKPLQGDTGNFVGRRPQAYGNNLWCYLELENGSPIKMFDFPVLGSKHLARDEAWRTQMAIDNLRGNPQVFRTVETNNDQFLAVNFFSPIPSWAQRRLDLVGEPFACPNCLFSYKLRYTEFDEEADFLKAKLWLQQDG